jgi:hypothetical protein
VVVPLGTAEYQKVVRTRMDQIQRIAREANIKVD